MCFYIWSAAGRALQVPYANEFIELGPFGAGRITVDIAVRLPEGKRSPEAESLLLLYPNRFYDYDGRLHLYVRTRTATDETVTLLEPDHRYNRAYLSGGWRYAIDGHTVSLSIPRPGLDERPAEFRATVYEPQQRVLLAPRMTTEQYALLQAIEFSLFEVPVEDYWLPEETRMMRFRFHPRNVTRDNLPWGKKLLLFAGDSLEFNYSVMGPYDVALMAMEMMGGLRHLVASINSLAAAADGLLDGPLRRLRNACAQPGLKRAQYASLVQITEYGHYFLHVRPGHLKLLHNRYAVGRIRPRGTVPGRLFRPEPVDPFQKLGAKERLRVFLRRYGRQFRRRVYDWELDPHWPLMNPSFTLFFSARLRNLFNWIVVYLVLVPGVIHLETGASWPWLVAFIVMTAGAILLTANGVSDLVSGIRYLWRRKWKGRVMRRSGTSFLGRNGSRKLGEVKDLN